MPGVEQISIDPDPHGFILCTTGLVLITLSMAGVPGGYGSMPGFSPRAVDIASFQVSAFHKPMIWLLRFAFNDKTMALDKGT